MFYATKLEFEAIDFELETKTNLFTYILIHCYLHTCSLKLCIENKGLSRTTIRLDLLTLATLKGELIKLYVPMNMTKIDTNYTFYLHNKTFLFSTHSCEIP